MGGLLGAIGAILIFIVMIPQFITMWEQGNSATQQRVCADHLRMVVRAAGSYVGKHQDTFLSQAQAGSGPSFTVPDMIRDGLLPQGFSERNLWQQSYIVHVRQPEQGSLQAVVLTTGGRGASDGPASFANVVVPGAAALAGGSGGYIPTGVLPGQPSTTLQGAGGGWALDLASVGIASPGAGHLGALSTYDASSLGQDFLYRVAVPGMPELNAMQTELDMSDHAVDNAQSVQFVEREISSESCTADEDQGRMFLDREQGLYLCRNHSLEIVSDTGNAAHFKEAAVVANGARVTKPACAPGTNTTPAIYVAPQLAAAGAQAPPITAFQAWATSVSSTEWQVHLRLQTPNPNLGDDENWISPAADYARILVLTQCVKSGS